MRGGSGAVAPESDDTVVAGSVAHLSLRTEERSGVS